MDGQEKQFTQEELDAAVEKRLAKERKKYADYEDLKEKAAKYDEFSSTGKTDLQKQTERADKAEKELADMKKAQTVSEIRAKVAKEKNIPANLLTGEDEDTCNAQADTMLGYFRPNRYPNVPDGGESFNNGKRTTADDFGDWMSRMNI